MLRKKIIVPHRVRKITGTFSFIPHRFFSGGFWGSLERHELLLYLFLVMVSDKDGLSFYGTKKICSLLHLSNADYLDARDRLLFRKLIAVEKYIFQVLELPAEPVLDIPEKSY
jgi:hypothetical protein